MAIFDELGEGFVGEVETMETFIRRLAAIMDGEDDGENGRLWSTVNDAEKAMKER